MTRGHRRNVHLGSESGQAMVEFALILPFLAAFVVLIIQAGTAFNYWNDLNQMAADGARRAAVNNVPGGDLTSFITNEADSGDLRTHVKVCITFGHTDATGKESLTTTPQAGDAIKITTMVPFSLANIAAPSNDPNSVLSIKERGKATMRLEATPTFTYDPLARCD